MGLFRVADGAYPQPDYSFLPDDVHVWAGYLGGDTPHAWTHTEIAQLEAAGLTFWSIWTAPVAMSITGGQARDDAAAMAARLALYTRPLHLPVIYDIEHSSWAANPAQTTASAQLWVQLLRQAGYVNAGWYGPCGSAAPWQACWSGDEPVQVPPGLMGIQYDHALSGDRYDISVFDDSRLVSGGSDDMSAADVTAINAHTDTKIQQLLSRLLGNADASGPTTADLGALIHSNTDGVRAQLAAVAAQVKADTPDVFAAALAPLLAPLLPAVTTDQLATALAAVYAHAFGTPGA